jgi:hypothetical protein
MMLRRTPQGRTHHRSLLNSAALVIIGGCLRGCAWHDYATTWSAEARSPDGLWVATAESVQNGGPGTAYDSTAVYLRQSGQKPAEILGFSHQYATINLHMKWLTPAHLEVTYGPSGRPGDTVNVDFQAVKFAAVEISLRYVPPEASKQPPAERLAVQ